MLVPMMTHKGITKSGLDYSIVVIFDSDKMEFEASIGLNSSIASKDDLNEIAAMARELTTKKGH